MMKQKKNCEQQSSTKLRERPNLNASMFCVLYSVFCDSFMFILLIEQNKNKKQISKKTKVSLSPWHLNLISLNLFYTTWKQKTGGFWMFLEGKERDSWYEMG